MSNFIYLIKLIYSRSIIWWRIHTSQYQFFLLPRIHFLSILIVFILHHLWFHYFSCSKALIKYVTHQNWSTFCVYEDFCLLHENCRFYFAEIHERKSIHLNDTVYLNIFYQCWDTSAIRWALAECICVISTFFKRQVLHMCAIVWHLPYANWKSSRYLHISKYIE